MHVECVFRYTCRPFVVRFLNNCLCLVDFVHFNRWLVHVDNCNLKANTACQRKNKDHCGVTNYTNLKVWMQQHRPKFGLGDSSLSKDGSKKKQKHISLTRLTLCAYLQLLERSFRRD